MNQTVAGYSENLIRTILEHKSSLSLEQLWATGIAARNILTFAWNQPVRNSSFMTMRFEAFAKHSAAILQPLRRCFAVRLILNI